MENPPRSTIATYVSRLEMMIASEVSFMSRKYSKVERFVWRDPEYRGLDLIAQHTWLHLLTSPLLTSIPGLIPASLTTIADEMGLVLSEEFRDSFESLVALGWVKIDPVARLIFLPGAVKHNPPESLNVITGWGRSFHEIPDSQLKYEWLQGFIAFCNAEPGEKFNRPEAVSRAFAKDIETLSIRIRNPFETLSKPFRTPDPSPSPDPEPFPKPEQKKRQEEGGVGEGVELEPSENHGGNLQRTIPLTLEESSNASNAEERAFAVFSIFWAAYPRKLAKGDAYKAWKQTAKERPSLPTILAAIEAQKGSDGWTKDGGGFIPYPATWLRAHRWDDEVEKPRKPETDADRRRRLEDEDFKRGLAAADEARQAEEEDDCGD